jgi:phosphate transport system ATP-binding protein
MGSPAPGGEHGRRRAVPTATPVGGSRDAALTLRGVSVHYGDAPALLDLDLDVEAHAITAIIGPSGSGKSTLLAACNRMLELTPGTRVRGSVHLYGHDVYARGVDAVEVRRRIGLVADRPVPFDRSIRENVTFGPRLHGVRRRDHAPIVERSLRRVGLWSAVHDRLDSPARTLSLGQQQALCIARSLATEPDVLLLDEPCATLDPIATLRIEELLRELRRTLTIVLVTHDLQQAARVSDRTALLAGEHGGDTGRAQTEGRAGRLIEVGDTVSLFTRPAHPRTEAYVTGRAG